MRRKKGCRMSKAFEKFYQLQKVEDARQSDGSIMHVMYGVATAAKPDRDNEIVDFEDISQEYRRRSQEAYDSTTAAGQEPSRGNLRIQHDPHRVGGKVIGIDYDRQRKEIRVKSTPKDEQVWSEVLRGIWRGYSHAGSYKFRRCSVCNCDVKGKDNWCGQCQTSANPITYSAVLAELSIVDSPALREAAFEYVKADGAVEMRKFVADAMTTVVGTWWQDDWDDSWHLVPPTMPPDDRTRFEHDLNDTMCHIDRTLAIPVLTASGDVTAFDLESDTTGLE